MQRAANQVRVNAQLIDARNDAHLWAQTYDRDLADVFAIQSEIAKAIADQLQAKLSPNEKKAIEQPPTTDLAAFDLYSRAKSLLLTTAFSATGEPDVRKAIELVRLGPKAGRLTRAEGSELQRQRADSSTLSFLPLPALLAVGRTRRGELHARY